MKFSDDYFKSWNGFVEEGDFCLKDIKSAKDLFEQYSPRHSKDKSHTESLVIYINNAITKIEGIFGEFNLKSTLKLVYDSIQVQKSGTF